MIKQVTLTIMILLFLVGIAFAAININTANEQQLQELTGVGPVTAEAIIEYREANDGFDNIDELMEVRGIGPRTLEQLRDQVTVAD